MVSARSVNAIWLIRSCWHNRRAFIWTAAALAFLLRIAACFAINIFESDPWVDRWAFGWEYGRIARWLVERGVFSLDGVVPTSETDPLYSFIIAPFFYVFGSFTIGAGIALVVLQALLCGLTTWAIFVLAEKLYGPTEARIAALLFACYPGSIFFAVSRIGPTPLSILLLCLLFIVILDVPNVRRFTPAVLSGLIAGLLFLTTGHTLSLLLVIPLWLFLVSKGQRIRTTVASLLFVLTAMLVLIPWSVRNSMVLGEASISKSNLDYHLWVGNNPNAKGYYIKDPSHAIRPRGEASPPYYRMAFSWIADNPEQFVVLTLKRIKYFWYITPDRGNSTSELLHVWIFLSVVGFALVGVIWSGESFARVSLLLLFIGVFPALFYVTNPSFFRHRVQIEPFVLILASHGLYRLWSTVVGSRGEGKELSAQGIHRTVA